VVAGKYGREITSDAIFHALKSHRHVSVSAPMQHSIDIPAGILGIRNHKEHRGILRLLTKSKMRELTQFEPDTLITQLPLITPGFATPIIHKILPRMLVLTHVGLERMDLFITKETIGHEYLSLANTLQQDAVVVLNEDDESLRNIRGQIERPVITYGVHPKADVRIARAERSQKNNGLFLEVIVHGKHEEIFLPKMFAKQHVQAVAGAIAVAHGLGIPVQDAMHGLRALKPMRGILSRVSGMNGSIVVDDSLRTCPEQLQSSLKSFATLTASGRKIIVLGDMDGLGVQAIRSHKEAGIQSTSANMIIFVGDMMRHAQEAVLQTGQKIDTHHFSTSSEAGAWLPEYIREGDMVFVSGGNSMNMGKVVKQLIG